MKSHLIVLTMTFSIVVSSASCRDRGSAANLMKETRTALAAKGMTVGTFDDVRDYPATKQGRSKVQCAAVSRNESDCRVCVVSYDDDSAAIAAANLKFRSDLPEAAQYFVRGKLIFVVEPGPRQSTSLNQEVYDELQKLP